MEMKAIDISHHNGNVDFEKVKAAGIDGVFIRTGYGKFLQSQITISGSTAGKAGSTV